MVIVVKEDVPVKNNIVIPGHEVEVTASRAGGPGGQHVNKASTKITLRWNVHNTTVLTDEQKERVLEKLASELTEEGDVIIHNKESRSQAHNKKAAMKQLGKKIAKALYVKKKRMKTRVPKEAKEARLKEKNGVLRLKRCGRQKSSNKSINPINRKFIWYLIVIN